MPCLQTALDAGIEGAGMPEQGAGGKLYPSRGEAITFLITPSRLPTRDEFTNKGSKRRNTG